VERLNPITHPLHLPLFTHTDSAFAEIAEPPCELFKAGINGKRVSSARNGGECHLPRRIITILSRWVESGGAQEVQPIPGGPTVPVPAPNKFSVPASSHPSCRQSSKGSLRASLHPLLHCWRSHDSFLSPGCRSIQAEPSGLREPPPQEDHAWGCSMAAPAAPPGRMWQKQGWHQSPSQR